MSPPGKSEFRIGQTVKNRYQLLSIVGEGGQGCVYKARDVRDGDEVAIKILNGRTSDPAAMERMVREAGALATLWGTCAVKVLDSGFTEDGSFVMVMELLVGEDLETVCQRFEDVGQHVPIPWVVSVFEPVMATLEKAHLNGIVHRDLKPANVFLLSAEVGGGVRLLDFGFAKFLRMTNLTAPGMLAGSPTYVAPETWKGVQADPRVDVYSLAAMMYRVVAGRPPFTAPSLGELLKTVSTAPRPSLCALRPDLPEAMDDWAQYALAIDRGGRFQTVRAVFNAFVNALGPAAAG